MLEKSKNMKDGDSLNMIVGYAKHAEGTQHSEHLSKVYLDTIKIQNSNVKVEPITQKCNGSNKRKTQSTGPKARVNLIPKAIVIIVVQTIYKRSVLPMAKCAILVIKKVILSRIADPDRDARAREDGNQGNPDVISMKLPVQTTETKVMTPIGFSMNKTQYRCYLVEIFMTLCQTFSLMKLMVKEFNMCLLT